MTNRHVVNCIFAVRMHHTIRLKEFNAQGFGMLFSWFVAPLCLWCLVFDMTVNTGISIHKVNQIHLVIAMVAIHGFRVPAIEIQRFGQMFMIHTTRTEKRKTICSWSEWSQLKCDTYAVKAYDIEFKWENWPTLPFCVLCALRTFNYVIIKYAMFHNLRNSSNENWVMDNGQYYVVRIVCSVSVSVSEFHRPIIVSILWTANTKMNTYLPLGTIHYYPSFCFVLRFSFYISHFFLSSSFEAKIICLHWDSNSD